MSAVKTSVNVCPFEGCECSFKGLKTLFNHYSRFHNDNDKTAMELYDAWMRKPTKPKSKSVKVKAVQIVPELTLEEMTCGLLQLINEATPCVSLSPDPTTLPLPSFVHLTDDETVDLIVTDLVDELEMSHDETTDDVTCVDTTTDDTTTDDVTCDYNKYLVDCCLTMHDGGFVKAYKVLKRGDVSYAVNPNASLYDTKEQLENVFNALCDAWLDYTRSDEFDDTHADMFDDDADWLDVCGYFVTPENYTQFH